MRALEDPVKVCAPPPDQRQELRIVRAIRQIIRAVDLYSHRLQAQYRITMPQLSCLLKVVQGESITLKSLADGVYLSPSTVVGIVDRLEAKQLVTRIRSTGDRRQVLISATPSGRALIAKSPSPLHERLVRALEALPEQELATITASLEKVVRLMGIGHSEASPILETGPIEEEMTPLPASEQSPQQLHKEEVR